MVVVEKGYYDLGIIVFILGGYFFVFFFYIVIGFIFLFIVEFECNFYEVIIVEFFFVYEFMICVVVYVKDMLKRLKSMIIKVEDGDLKVWKSLFEEIISVGMGGVFVGFG